MSERARALEQARETALRTDAAYLSPSGRIVRVQGHKLTGRVIVDSRGRVAVRNVDTDRLSYVHEADLRELAVDPPPSGASPQAETSANVRALTVHICDDCLNLRGEMCNEPCCRFCRRTMAEVAEYLDVLLIRPRIDGVSVLVDEGTPLPPVSPVEPTGAKRHSLTDWIPTPGCDCDRCTSARKSAPKPTGGASPQAETRRDCTCLGTCRGAEGLGPRWKCALETPAPISPVEPTPPMLECCACGHLNTPQQATRLEGEWRSSGEYVCLDSDACARRIVAECSNPPVEPAPEPETCEWRWDHASEVWRSSCPTMDYGDEDAKHDTPTMGWKVCPYCTHPVRLVPSEETK